LTYELKTCTICKKNQPIESFEKYRYQCKECRRKYKKEKYKSDKINQANSKNAFVQSIQQSVDNLNRTTTRCKYNIWMSPLTYEELLRKQIWYDEPEIHGTKKRWVEPINHLIRRLVDTSNTEKEYNYKTFQIKRSKFATICKTVDEDTYLKLKEIHDELKITYDEIIWRLIGNDKSNQAPIMRNKKRIMNN
jgi:hypothetical protein